MGAAGPGCAATNAEPTSELCLAPFLVADMVRVHGNEMGDLRGTVYMKTIDRILN